MRSLSGQSRPLFQRYWFWILAGVVVVGLASAVLLIPAARFYWDFLSFKAIYHDDLGLSNAWSSVAADATAIADVLALGTSLSWLIWGRRRIAALLCTLFVFGVTPALHGLLGAGFNQRTGGAEKWYAWRNGVIVLSDSPGFDAVTGVRRQPLTSQMAEILQRQKQGIRPEHTKGDPRTLTFFDPTTGRSLVWYARTSDGGYDLFDNEGFDPADGQLLRPVDAQSAAAIRKWAAAQAAKDRTAAAIAQQHAADEAKQAARRQAEDVFVPASYPAGVTVVGIRATQPSDRVSTQAAADLQSSLISALRKAGSTADDFRSRAYAPPYFERLLDGDSAALEKSGLAQKMRIAIVASTQASCREAESTAGLTSCTVAAAVRVFKAGHSSPAHVTETSAGLTVEDALSRAVQLLVIRHPDVFSGTKG